MATVQELMQMKREKEAEISSLKQQLSHIRVTVPELTDDEKDALEEQRLRAGAEAYMGYDPNTAQSWLNQADTLKANKENKLNAQKQRVSAYLNEVAAEFQNIDPADQAAWSEARSRWIAYEPGLADYVPGKANQDNWDRIQSQGGNKTAVAPKGEFATRNYLDKQVQQYTYLSAQARAAGNSAKADNYAKKAMELQDQLDGAGDKTLTVEGVLEKYNSDIEALKAKVTTTQLPSTVSLFNKIAEDIGEGAVLDGVKKSINEVLESTKSGNLTGRNLSDEDLKAQASALSTQANDLVASKRKIASARELIKAKISSGAARIAAKDLQGDVLAESEFSGYKNNDPLVQAFNYFANKLVGVSFITLEDAKSLVNALISTYNSTAGDYIKALGDNKYRNKMVTLVDTLGDESATPPSPPPETPLQRLERLKKQRGGK